MFTCKIALDNYYREQIAVKAVDRRRAEYAIEALNSFFADMPLQAVDIPACRNYHLERLEDGVSDSTIRRELGVLKAAGRHALRWRHIKPDALPSIELPPEAAPRRSWLFHDELNNLLDTAEQTNGRVFRFCQIAYHTGSRRAAVERLKWSQVDLQTRQVNLQCDSAPLTKKRRPIVPISAAMAEELSGLKSIATNEWVLGSPEPVYEGFVRVAKRAGLYHLPQRGLRQEGQLCPHILRHSRATHLLQNGKSPWQVANLLGDTLHTLLRVYGHACTENMAELVS